MKTILRGLRPLDYALAAATTALGVVLMIVNMRATGDKDTPIDSTSWTLIPVFAAATLPILWRRRNLWAVLGVTAAALAAHDLVFGWVVRCGAGLPLSFALAYAAGRLMTDRRQALFALAAVAGIQVLVLVRDSAAGLGVIPFTIAIAAAIWGVGRYVLTRSQRTVVIETAPRVTTFA